MIERVYDFMCENRMISPGARILAAVSGGADSMCLLEILRRIRHRLPFEICVLHVHHGLRERAKRASLFRPSAWTPEAMRSSMA